MKKTEMTAGLMALGLVLAGCSSAVKEEQAPVQQQDPETEQTESEKTVQDSPAEADLLKDQTEEKTEQEPQEPAVGGDQIRPEFKAAMDGYVAFYEDYAAFMQRYRQNPSDLNLLLEMTDWMTRTESVTEELDKLEDSQQEMNAAELRYYLDATGRILELMSQAAS